MIDSSSRFVSSLGLSNLRAGSIAQGHDSHASRTEQNFPKIILGKEGTLSPIKYDPPPDFFFGKKDAVYEFWPSVLNVLRMALRVGLAMPRA